jgi:phage tail protein X
VSEYITRQGDRVDFICWKHYGTERGGTTEAVLEANPHLADNGHTLPAGLTIILPDLAQPATDDSQIIHLWD